MVTVEVASGLVRLAREPLGQDPVRGNPVLRDANVRINSDDEVRG